MENKENEIKKVKPEIGMKVRTNKKGMIGTIIRLSKNYALIALDIGYRETFYYKDLRYIKE